MQNRPRIDAALGLDLVATRTLSSREGRVSVVIPAHNEEETIAEVVRDAFNALSLLRSNGEVIVAASGCTDETAKVATKAGARVTETEIGKGNAIIGGVQASTADIICLIDGDFRYFGDVPLVASLVAPILRNIADVTIADLYWRPLYPQLWLHGFFAPLAGRLFPEILPKVGNTPWSGQRAAPRELWPETLPEDFTADISLLLHWNEIGHARMRPVLADDWTNPQRPKPDLLHKEFQTLIKHAVKHKRIAVDRLESLEQWFNTIHHKMAEYRPDHDDPQKFETALLDASIAALGSALDQPR